MKQEMRMLAIRYTELRQVKMSLIFSWRVSSTLLSHRMTTLGLGCMSFPGTGLERMVTLYGVDV
jgi:hypothetical protein